MNRGRDERSSDNSDDDRAPTMRDDSLAELRVQYRNAVEVGAHAERRGDDLSPQVSLHMRGECGLRDPHAAHGLLALSNAGDISRMTGEEIDLHQRIGARARDRSTDHCFV